MLLVKKKKKKKEKTVAHMIRKTVINTDIECVFTVSGRCLRVELEVEGIQRSCVLLILTVQINTGMTHTGVVAEVVGFFLKRVPPTQTHTDRSSLHRPLGYSNRVYDE